jgi:hypothetical protein
MRRHGVVAGTPQAQAIAAVIRALQASEALPSPGDDRVLIPPAMEAWARQVPSTPIKLVYVVTAQDVALFTLWVR